MCIDLQWSNFILERMELPIWQRWFCIVGSPCIAEAINWSQPLHTVEKLLFWKFLFVQSYLENFLCHQAAAVPVLPTDNISPVCRYITKIWPILMACTWKNLVLLAVFLVKISIFHLGQMEHRWARCDGPLWAQHHALISFIWCCTTYWTRKNQAESTELSRLPPPRVDFCLVGSPRAGHVFEWAIMQPIGRNDP